MVTELFTLNLAFRGLSDEEEDDTTLNDGDEDIIEGDEDEDESDLEDDASDDDFGGNDGADDEQ